MESITRNIKFSIKEEMTEEETEKMFTRMYEELGGPAQCSGEARMHRRLWTWAYRAGQTIVEFTASNWWAKEGFNNRGREMFWMLKKYDRPEGKSKAAFLDACRGNELTRYRNIGKFTIMEALKVLGYKRLRARCKHCAAYIADRGEHPQLDLWEVTKTED